MSPKRSLLAILNPFSSHEWYIQLLDRQLSVYVTLPQAIQRVKSLSSANARLFSPLHRNSCPPPIVAMAAKNNLYSHIGRGSSRRGLKTGPRTGARIGRGGWGHVYRLMPSCG